ncbi:glycosyl transferase [Rhizobium sp. P40RR-XXII]|uniref:glycosyl transferase n=1 Tax=unclassified Rhizobium TaxID=2613769 RepID=UPI0014568E90|nr:MULTISPECIES: glycosyl transferase [unclassified Rhizobium]NLR87937.1 glycosyl transferase [Rhizobium sp. P28RR-XV]NLS19558.1 glycosyl transferase [Rhizobium sp. P40RR-XXII]
MADRPWHRSLIKSGVRLFLGGSLAHVQDWFPGLSIVRSQSISEVHYRGAKVASLAGMDRLRERCGDAIYIVGSGPSIRGCDLSGLEAKSAILLNGAIGLTGDPIGEPLAIAVEDERFVWRHIDLLRKKVAPGSLCLFSVAVLRALCEIDKSWLADKTIILIDDIRKPYGARRRSLDDLRKLQYVQLDAEGSAGFSLSPDRGVFLGGSVAVSALQFALYCAQHQVGFMGIDISNAGEPRFYETVGDMAFSGIARAESRIIEHLVLARQIATERGVSFVNYSPISALLKYDFGYNDRFAMKSKA